MPYPDTCHDFLAIGRHNTSDTFSKDQFLNMTVAATMDNGNFVLNQTKRIEATTPPGTKKGLWHDCVTDCGNAISALGIIEDHLGEPLEECDLDEDFGTIGVGNKFSQSRPMSSTKAAVGPCFLGF
ncbi:hypothetical protein OSB04_026234 [Centaurea solstitialis]|uniref:Uncharacterized protein n=1 Tax=Centaurea solstitialis TaxID=347529 RepID=A0AA38SCB5_9ASTR|nr:hypothetical protein OSB04_026234 [Centaurea solstitialis]